MDFDISKITDMMILFPAVLGAIVTLVVGFWLAGIIAKRQDN